MEYSPEVFLKLLDPLEEEFALLVENLNQTSDFSSPEYRAYQHEFNRIQKILELKAVFLQIQDQLEGVRQILKSEEDPELLVLSQQEEQELITKFDDVAQQITFLTIPPDPNDEKDIFVEMRSGAGGDEAGIFIGDLFRMYSLYAQDRGFRIEIIDSHEGTAGGYKDLTFSLSGEAAYSLFKYESGVHRVQRVPKTETQGRIHTSTITVAVMPEADELNFEIAPDDLKIETTRAQGAGGQHVNKTESAIKIYHIPTGIVVQSQEERSQYKNKERAMKILKAKVKEHYERQQKSSQDSFRRSQIGTGDRAEKIRTYNFPQNRVTDHRINFTLHNLDRMLNGDIQPLLDQLILEDKKSILEHYLRRFS